MVLWRRRWDNLGIGWSFGGEGRTDWLLSGLWSPLADISVGVVGGGSRRAVWEECRRTGSASTQVDWRDARRGQRRAMESMCRGGPVA